MRRARRLAEGYARRTPGVLVQPDLPTRRHVLRGLARNLVEHGRPYCPCRPVSGDAEADRANICPCRSAREEIRGLGECECGLFVANAEEPEQNQEG
ncbi:MAG: ferredoxin-thioredoxin reductase catalytic domain-containing protein [Candidatus Brocadiia bacterium]